MVIVDSSVWIDFLNDRATQHTTWLDNALGNQEMGLTSLILCEVLQGTRNDRHFRQMLEQLSMFAIFEGPTAETAIAAAQNFRLLQRRGITVRKSINCMIATFCILAGHQLLHNDRDFDHFEEHLGLIVVDARHGYR